MRHLRGIVRRLKSEARFLRMVATAPETPRLARWLLLAALAYALSPIDLVPDWVPLLGQIDDLVIVPLLVWLGLRLTPAPVVADCRRRAFA